MLESKRARIFAALATLCAVAAVGYLLVASRAPQLAPAAPVARSSGPAVVAGATAAARRFLTAAGVTHGRIFFRDLDRGDTTNWGRIAVAPVGPGRRTLVGTEHCERVYFAAGRGLCLAKGGGFGTLYSAEILDADRHVLHHVALGGIPSRARISRDGRYGATTTFVSGHSYNTPGKFSTQTLLIDMRSGKTIANLERFTVTRDGHAVDKPDVNFWGVTFARDSNRFYATMATGGKTYLIQGNVATRTAHTLHENVECPSLSPDGTRIAYKKLVELAPGTPRIWHLHVLDLRTMKDTALAEPDPIDDQAEWLGNRVVVYGSGEEVRAVRADGSGRPVTLLTSAVSPAVVS